MALDRRAAALLGAACCLALSGTARAEEAAPDKSRYDLFFPTPEKLMRGFSTDRPDQTEGPFTVDAGHFQLESDFLNATYDRVHVPSARLRATSYSLGTINLRAGLLELVDCHCIFSPYVYQDSKDFRTREHEYRQGWSDLTFRIKLNLWGNDGGRTAFALLPYVSFPVARKGLGSDAYEGGIILPLNVVLEYGFSLGVHLQLGAQRDENGSGTHMLVTVPLSLSYEIVEGLQAYLELYDEQTTERHVPWVGQVDVGVTWVVVPNVQLDVGCHTGITRAANDVNAFAGISVRY